MAGKTKLMNQTVTDVNPIPNVFIENNPINRILISPLNHTSTKAIDGMTAIAKKTTLITVAITGVETLTSNK